MTNAIEIQGLCKKYKHFSLGEINLTLPEGCIMGLIGENGAGKTTMMKCILGMFRFDSGTIRVLGKDNQDYFERTKEDIGVVLDETGLHGSFRAKHVDKVMTTVFQRWNSKVFYEYLEKLEIPTNTAFGKLSKGMKMKVGLAIALSHEPKLLILDEATAGLDPVARDTVMDIVREFTRDENHSVLISSHIVSDLEKVCDYIAFLHQGKLLLSEEKDRLCEMYGILHCPAEQLKGLPERAVIGKKVSPYGAEVLVDRTLLPDGIKVSPVDMETLFIFITKKEDENHERIAEK